MKIANNPSMFVMTYLPKTVGHYYFSDFESALEFILQCIENDVHFDVFAEVDPTPCKHTKPKKKVYKKKKVK